MAEKRDNFQADVKEIFSSNGQAVALATVELRKKVCGDPDYALLASADEKLLIRVADECGNRFAHYVTSPEAGAISLLHLPSILRMTNKAGVTVLEQAARHSAAVKEIIENYPQYLSEPISKDKKTGSARVLLDIVDWNANSKELKELLAGTLRDSLFVEKKNMALGLARRGGHKD